MTELENLIILLNIGSLSFLLHSIQVPSIDFCDAGEGVEVVYNRKLLNRDCISYQKWTKFKIVIIIIIIIILYQ